MPPKPKCTKSEMAAAALNLIKTEGLESLSARALGRKLGISASAVITAFHSMDEVKQAARELAMADFMDYIRDYPSHTPAFKWIGMRLVSYSKQSPELFQLLFMPERPAERGVQSIFGDLGDFAQLCTSLIERDYAVGHEEAALLLEQLWVLAFGLSTMCITDVCELSDEEIGRRLSIAFAGHMMMIRSGNLDKIHADTEYSPDGIFHGRAVGDLPYDCVPDNK